MEFIGVLLGVAVLAGLAVWALRRRGSDEMHSVAGYQARLERLEEVRRRQIGSVRIVGGARAEDESPEGRIIGEDGRIEVSSSASRRRAFENTNRIPVYAERRPAPQYRRRGRDMAIARMGHRPRRLGAPIAAAVAVIILVTGLAIAGAHSRSPHTTTSTTVAHHKANSGRSTTTTAPRPTTFSPQSTSGQTATYQLPFSSYTLFFTATTGDCYVEVTNAQGQVPYASVLHVGQTEQLTLTGNSQVDLGAPAYVQVEIDRTAVNFPNPVPAPLNLVFNAQSSGTASTTTTTG